MEAVIFPKKFFDEKSRKALCCCGAVPEVERMMKVYYICRCGCGRWGLADSEEGALAEFHKLHAG